MNRKLKTISIECERSQGGCNKKALGSYRPPETAEQWQEKIKNLLKAYDYLNKRRVDLTEVVLKIRKAEKEMNRLRLSESEGIEIGYYDF